MSKAAELAALIGSQTALSNRNLIINGAMQVAQRGTSSTGVTGGSYQTVDRFRTGYNGTPDQLELTHEQSTDAPTGFSNSLKLTVTTAETTLDANERIRLSQRIEGQNLQHLKYGTSDAEYLTLSFYVKSNVTGTYGVHFENRDSSRSVCSSYTISAANTWEKKTVSIAGDTTGSFDNDNERSLDVHWVLAAGTNYTSGTFATSWESDTNANNAPSGQADITNTVSNYFQITGVQLEVGETATPFEHRSYGDELARCQRYYQQYLNPPLRGTMSAGSASSRTGMILPVPMRATPSVTFTQTGATSHAALFNGSASYTISSIQASYLADFCIEFDFNLASTPTAATPAALYQSSTLQSKFAVSAEL